MRAIMCDARKIKALNKHMHHVDNLQDNRFFRYLYTRPYTRVYRHYARRA
jgi:hypothetical protein